MLICHRTVPRVVLDVCILFFIPEAGETRESPKPIGSRARLRSDTDLVLVPTSVVDSNDRFISTLWKGDFSLFDNGVEQQLLTMSVEDKPLSVSTLKAPIPDIQWRFKAWAGPEEKHVSRRSHAARLAQVDTGRHGRWRANAASTQDASRQRPNIVHIPMIVEGLGFNRGIEIPELVSQMDRTPSRLAAAGVPVPETMQEHNFLPLLDRRNEGWRKEATSSSPGARCERRGTPTRRRQRGPVGSLCRGRISMWCTRSTTCLRIRISIRIWPVALSTARSAKNCRRVWRNGSPKPAT